MQLLNIVTLLTINLYFSIVMASDIPFECKPITKNREYFLSAPKEKNIKGVTILLHGFNLSPDAMIPIETLLKKNGQLVIRGALTGHRGNVLGMEQVTSAKWIADMKGLYCIANNFAKNKLPIRYVGYSIGGLLPVYLKTLYPTIKVRGMFLLAPAIKLTILGKLSKVFFILNDKVVIPSSNHPLYRANDGATVAAYQAFHSIVDKLSKVHLANIKTTVFLNSNDILVSTDKLTTMITDQKLTNWKLASFKLRDDEKAEINKGNHLILDERTLPKRIWQNLSHLIDKFYSENIEGSGRT